MRVVTAGDDQTACVWAGQLLTPSADWARDAISLWTGLTADERGRVRELTVPEWSALAARFHSSDDRWPVALRNYGVEMLSDTFGRQLAEISRRLKGKPDDVELLTRRVELLACIGNFEAAIEDLRSCLIWRKPACIARAQAFCPTQSAPRQAPLSQSR
jgi:hypothetical protein